ncbi:MAG TPA: Ig-like domain-containing protein [Kofleriaceae bacterium]|nr:Ig-like domain-containing protein [Kofleriaceae bacterium]
MRQLKYVGLVALALTACADNAYDPDAPAIDPNAPRVHITSPARGTIAGDVQKIEVKGTATDDSGVDSVLVNGVAAQVAADGTFTAYVPLVPGTNLIHAIAKDKQGNEGKESRAVVAGPMATLARHIPESITATLSAQTFDAIGRGVAGFLKNGDLMTTMQGMNPVVNSGAPDGPDCLYAQAFITSMSVQDADILMSPQNGGVFLSGELTNVRVGMHLQWAVACADGSRDVVISASKVSISGMLNIGLAGRNFDIKLVTPNVTITGFNLNLGGVPQTIIDMLNLNSVLGPVLAWGLEKIAVPVMNKSLAGLNDTKTIDVLGTKVDIDVKPSHITFTREGGTVLLDTSLRAHNDSGTMVFVPNTVPDMDMSQGFQLAVADDAANQLLTSMWSAKGMDTTIDLKNGSYGEVGTLYDSVQLEVKVPPYVDAASDKLVLTVGDMIANFKLGGSPTAAVAINAQVEMKVAKGTDGKFRLDVGTPTTYVDILDENIEGANQLSNAQFEAIASFALSRVVSVGSGAVGAIPLPQFGGVGVTQLSIDSKHGYLVVNGEIQ